jgi:hypothetical protein
MNLACFVILQGKILLEFMLIHFGEKDLSFEFIRSGYKKSALIQLVVSKRF